MLMKYTAITFMTLVISASITTASAQVVHPAGAPTILLNWQPASTSDSVSVDVDGDAVVDVTFREANELAAGAGQATRYIFTAHTRSAGTELGLDSLEFASVRRFASAEPIRWGLRWTSSSSGYVAYTLIGNGGTGGLGFFRNGASGYVVVRKRIAGNWAYWWFNVTGRTSSTNSRVNFYGQSSTVLTAAPSSSAAQIQLYPNPTTTSWYLVGHGSYQLADCHGNLVEAGTVKSSANVGRPGLAAGIYLLQFRANNGTIMRQKLVKN
jgi:hypothetical protein